MPIGGPELEAEIRATPAIRPALIDSLLLEESFICVYAPYGQGKTSVLLSILAPGSIGQPVFGQLACTRPLRFYVFCPERSGKELKERFRRLLDIGIPLDLGNIQLDDGMTGSTEFCEGHGFLNTNHEIWAGIDHAVKNRFAGQPPDVVCVEGLYAMSRKAMGEADFAQFLMRFNREVYRRYKASVWYSSHTKKQQRKSTDGGLMELDEYGGVLILAQLTGAYLFQRVGAKDSGQSTMTQKKDTVSGLADKLAFTYDPETGLLKLDSTSPLVGAKEKFRLYINNCLRLNITFTFADLMKIGEVSQSTVAREIRQRVAEGSIVNTSPKGVNAIYRVNAAV